MINPQELNRFVESIYSNHPRGLIHGIEHSMRLIKDAELLGKSYKGIYDEEVLNIAGLLHGAIHYGEKEIKEWLRITCLSEESVEKIISVAWESQTKAVPSSLEGKMLHDAHFIERGKEFHLLKPFIVGAEMGQSLENTIEYVKASMRYEPVWYLPESGLLFNEIIQYTRTFINNMEIQLYLK